ncbi:hypothetical protein Tco_1333336 [Tanacetum coccineum]
MSVCLMERMVAGGGGLDMAVVAMMAAVRGCGAAMMVMIKRVVLWWAAVGRQPEEVEARGGEWIWGSGRSGHEDNIWFRPERSPENFSGGGGMVVAGIRQRRGRRVAGKYGEDGGDEKDVDATTKIAKKKPLLGDKPKNLM